MRFVPPHLPRPRLFWLTYFGIWILVSLGMGFSFSLYPTWTLLHAMITGFAEQFVWALMGVAAFLVAWNQPLDSSPRVRSVLLLLISVALILLVKQVVDYLSISAMPWLDPPSFSRLARRIPYQFALLLFFFGTGYGIDYFLRYREREIAATRLHSQLADARLRALKSQLQPHFLFNTLNAISTLMHRDMEAADRMLIRLSDMLRTSLLHAGTQEMTLEKEIDSLRPYLEIQEIRFGEMLSIHVEVPSDLETVLVPHLVLQPLVENAVQHGTSARRGPGEIWIRAAADGRKLRIEVQDTGHGTPEGWDSASTEGVGLENTRARLRQLYGNDSSLRAVNAPAGGFLVTVLLPLRFANGQTSDDESLKGRKPGTSVPP